MQLLIIRHAESSNNALAHNTPYDEYMRTRIADPEITELGRRQSQLLADHLLGDGKLPPEAPLDGKGSYGVTHIYCSAMLRTMQTIQPAAQKLGLNPEVWIDIHEHGGMFTGNPRTGADLTIEAGLTREELEAQFPGFVLPDGISKKGWWHKEYEDMPGCYGRAVRVAQELHRRAREEHEHGAVSVAALVSHGTFIDCLVKALFNQIPDRDRFYVHNNTGITRIDFAADGTLFLRYLNRTAHLTADAGVGSDLISQ